MTISDNLLYMYVLYKTIILLESIRYGLYGTIFL